MELDAVRNHLLTGGCNYMSPPGKPVLHEINHAGDFFKRIANHFLDGSLKTYLYSYYTWITFW
jgi:hypothetical protein